MFGDSLLGAATGAGAALVFLALAAACGALLLSERRGRALVAETAARMRAQTAELTTLREAFDQAERRRCEAAEREALLRATFDCMDQGVLIRSAEGVIKAANRRLLEMFELAPEAILGRPLEAVLRMLARQGEHGPDLDLEPVVCSRFDTENTPLYRGERVRPNGTILEMWARPMPDGGRLVTYTDVTERRRNERALVESEARYRALANAAQVGIWHIAADGETTIYANPTMLKLLQADSVEQIRRRPVKSFFAPASRRLFEAELERRFEGFSGAYEAELVGAKGRRRIALVNGAPLLDAEGRPQGALGVYTDITEEKSREEQLRQAQKLEMIGQLTGGVAHDFNNLLAVILGNLELLAERTELGQADRLVAAGMQAALRAAELTQRLLSFARRQPLQPRPVDAAGLVAGMADMLRRLLGETIRIRTRFAAGLPPALVDPGQLETALVNLAVNARDAMPEGGDLHIEVGETGGFVAVEVRDDGCGMTTDVAARAFEPFFTTKDVGKGSGLGLSMVHGFVNQSGGRVELSSAPSRGTSVRLLLPRAPASASQRAGAPAAVSAGAGEVVLLVEDDAAVRILVADMLKSLAYRVIEAEDGPQALAALEREPRVDALLTDVVLPNGLRGTVLARQAAERWADLACLCMSGYDPDAADSATPTLVKPFRRADLARALDAALQQRRAAAG